MKSYSIPTEDKDVINKEHVDDLVVTDHGTAAIDQVVNVCYGTDSAPTTSGTTEGALFIKYTA